MTNVWLQDCKERPWTCIIARKVITLENWQQGEAHKGTLLEERTKTSDLLVMMLVVREREQGPEDLAPGEARWEVGRHPQVPTHRTKTPVRCLTVIKENAGTAITVKTLRKTNVSTSGPGALRGGRIKVAEPIAVAKERANTSIFVDREIKDFRKPQK